MSNESILRAFMQRIWNEKKFDEIPHYVAESYKINLDNADPWEGKSLNHAEFIERLNFSFCSFPDIHFEIQSAISDGEHVAITWVMTGTNTGEIGGYPPTNQKIRANGVTLYHFRDGKICGHTQVYDRTSIMKQLGFLR